MFRSLLLVVTILMGGSMAGDATAQNRGAEERASRPGNSGLDASFDTSSQAPSLLEPARLSVQAVPLADAVGELAERSGILIAYSPSRLATEGIVDCDCSELTVGEALDHLLAGTSLRYQEVEGHVVILSRPYTQPSTPLNARHRVPSSPLVFATARGIPAVTEGRDDRSRPNQRQGTITGQVTDARSMRQLAGVQISIPGAGIGSLTDTEGRYTLRNVPSGEVTVRAERLGYRSAEHTVTLTPGDSLEMDFELVAAPLALDEVLVTGTAGEARRREIGTTIGQISTADLADPPLSAGNILRSRVPGMTVSMVSSQLGQGEAIRLRGNISMQRSNQPLIYIDGIRQAASSLPRTDSSGEFFAGTRSDPGALNTLNPSDIERVEVVKGAAAATMYGSEAAAGVIQIFTRRGVEGRPQWTYQTNQSLSRVQQFGSAERPNFNMDPYLKTAWGQQHTLSVSGGSSDIRYFLSGAIDDRDGIKGTSDHPEEQRKFDLRGNFDLQLTNDLSLRWNTSYTDDSLLLRHTGFNLYGIEFNAWRIPNNTVGSSDPEVIARVLEADILIDTRRLNTGMTLDYAPSRLPGLSNRLVVGLDRFNAETRQVTPFGYILVPQGSIDERIWARQSVTLDYTGGYWLHLTDAVSSRLSWGGQWIASDENEITGFGRNLPGPGEHTLSSTAIRQTGSSSTRVIDAGFFGQNVFDFRDRYFLTLGVRVDGNSTFGDDFGLQVYPKSGFAWVVSDEEFWPDHWGDLRLRGAFGEAGRAPGPFDATRSWAPESFDGQTAFLPDNLGDPDLGPERSREVEVGFEASVLNQRVQLDVTWFHQRTTDALLPVTGSASGGFLVGQLRNIGEIKNQGIELGVNASVMERPSFTWHLGASLATTRSEVLDTGGQSFSNIVEGHPAPVRRGVRVLNPDEFADPVFEENAFLGPIQPTTVLGLNTALMLPRGVHVSSRAEFQGGHWVHSGSWALVNRGGGWPGCDPSESGAYAHVPYAEYSADHPGLANVTARDRLLCYRETNPPGIEHFRGDFVRLRDVTVSVPVNAAVPRAESAHLSLSLGNIRIWEHSMRYLDPDGSLVVDDLDPRSNDGASKSTPAPMVATLSLRIRF